MKFNFIEITKSKTSNFTLKVLKFAHFNDLHITGEPLHISVICFKFILGDSEEKNAIRR